MSCAQQAAQQAQLAAVLSAVFVVLNVVSLLSFYGWRRAPAPWRNVLFAVFVFCALLIFDAFVYVIVPEPAAATAVHACR